MASSSTLERIAGLVDKLDPIARKQRGMRIEAQEWNTLVEVLLGVLQLDRLQEQRTDTLLDQRFATRDHEHLGQVGLAWLDADLQARLAGGGDSSIATRQLFSEMDRKIQALSDQMSKLSDALDASQRVLDDTIVNNSDKTRVLLDFERRFKGVEDLRTTVTTLSNQVGGVQANVDKVLELRKSLQDAAGNPINVAQIQRDLTDLQSIRENLKGADGKLLRLRDIEAKLNELADVVGIRGSDGLEGRFANLSASLEDTLDKNVDDKLTSAMITLREENSATENRLREEILVTSTQSRDASTLEIGTQIRDTTAAFNSTLDTRLNGLMESVTRDAVEKTGVLLDQRLADLPANVRVEVEKAMIPVRDNLNTTLQATLNATLTAQVREVETRLDQKTGAIETSNASLTQSIPGMVSARFDEALPGFSATLSGQVATEVEAARTSIESGLNSRVTTAVSNSLQNLDARIEAAVTERTANIDGKIETAVSAATRNFPAQVADEVKIQIEAANLDARIQDSARTITTQLRSELMTGLADQDARTSSTIQSTTTLLQGQVSASVETALKAAREFSTSQTGSLRRELNDLLEATTKATREEILAEVDRRLRNTRDSLTIDVRSQVDAQIQATNADISARVKTLESRTLRPT